jgi:hypothetical protein
VGLAIAGPSIDWNETSNRTHARRELLFHVAKTGGKGLAEFSTSFRSCSPDRNRDDSPSPGEPRVGDKLGDRVVGAAPAGRVRLSRAVD